MTDLLGKTDDKEKLVGALKRKSYKKYQSRATTPADSGFVDHSEESSPASDSLIETKFVPPQTVPVKAKGGRASSRLKAIKEEFDKLSPAQQDLKKQLEKCKSLPSRLRIDTKELERWNPIVMVRSMSLREIGRLTDDWSFIDHMKSPPRPRIAAKRLTLDGGETFVSGVWRDCKNPPDFKPISEVFPWERRKNLSRNK